MRPETRDCRPETEDRQQKTEDGGQRPEDRGEISKKNTAYLKEIETQLQSYSVLSPRVEAEMLITHFSRMDRMQLFTGAKKISSGKISQSGQGQRDFRRKRARGNDGRHLACGIVEAVCESEKKSEDNDGNNDEKRVAHSEKLYQFSPRMSNLSRFRFKSTQIVFRVP